MLGRRRGPRWSRVGYGIHRPVLALGDEPDDVRRRKERLADLAAWQLALPPTGRFTSLTAAEVRGWWLPPLPHDLPVFAAVERRHGHPQRRGLLVSRHEQVPEADVVGGLLLDRPADVILACARHLSQLDMVVLVDAALHLGHVTVAELEEVAATRRRGTPMLRRALALADGRSESAWETLLRLLHRVCDVPVQPQVELRDTTGSLVAVADLWLVGTRVLHEYDGHHHLARRRQRKDLRREREIGHIGWVRRGYTREDVLFAGIGILRDSDLTLGRPHRPERIRRWNALLVDSCLTPSGTQALRRRLALPGTADLRHRTG